MPPGDLTGLAAALASNGFAGHEGAVRDVVRAARAAGAPPGLTDVLADPGQPEVARLRAFGRVATALAARGRRPPASRPAA